MKAKNSLHRFSIVLLYFICSLNVYGQELPENATIGDISNLKEDITNRMKNIANSESEISEERRWLSTAKTSVLKVKNLHSYQGSPVELDKFKAEIIVLIDRVGKLDCDKIQESKLEMETILSEFNILSRDESIIDLFDQPREWLKVSNKFGKLHQYFSLGNRSVSTQFDEAECKKVKTIFTNSEIKTDLNNFIENRRKAIEKFSKENSEKLTMLSLVEQEINSYNQKLNEAWKKANTKMSLQTNLYLMILVIGLLSIGTIGIIRLFPENIMNEWVESGQVIQFVTVMILLSVIMSLGLAGLLSENTLGTLLGGIGGYVLSQGVGRSAARAVIKDIKDRTDSTK